MLKGHVGIGKFLLDIPGVDINVKDDKGRTVLANMIASLTAEKPLTRELVAEIKDMVERRGADPTIADNDGKNALHFLCQYNALPPDPPTESDEGFNFPRFNIKQSLKQEPMKDEQRAKDEYKKKWTEQKELLSELLKFLLDKGVITYVQDSQIHLACSVHHFTLATDKEGYMPVAYAFEASYDVDCQATTHRKYYGNIAMILDKMEEEASAFLWKEEINRLVLKKRIITDATKPNVMHVFCRNISLVAIDAEKSVYDSLLRVMKSMVRLVPNLAELDTVVEGSSPFFSLCKRYSEVADFEESHYRGSVAKSVVYADLEWDRNSRALLGMERQMEKFMRLIFDFERDFKPRLSYEYFVDAEKKQKAQVSVLSPLAECAYRKEGSQAFNAMLKYTSDVEVCVSPTLSYI